MRAINALQDWGINMSKKSVSSNLEGKELLAFYKARIDEFENERASLLDSIEKCSVQAGELHRLDWENRRRADEIRELQKALSDAHAFLFEERQRLLTLQAENDELRLQEIEDRKRIQQLIEYDPVVAARAGPSSKSDANMDALLLKIESLNAQLNEQRQLANERIQALVEDRVIREQEEQAHRALMNQQLEQAAQKLRQTEEMLRQATKDSILARRDKQQAEERAILAGEELLFEKQLSREEISALKRKAVEEVRELKQHNESKLDDIAGNLRKQLKVREDELINLGSVHTATKAQLEKRVTELEARSCKLAEQNKALDQRRHMDMEGFAADATHLRKMLASIDRKLHEMRLIDRLGEDDRLDSILAHLRQKNPSVLEDSDVTHGAGDRNSGRQSGGGNGSEVSFSVKSELAKGLREVKGRIKGLEDRLASKKKALAAEGMTCGSRSVISHSGKK
ncbi:hypothetical protein CEUSTIGMA_g146.t1 [Chlamydomonas eustigma]|uniref:Uncharacterized protein n=1 Tax=Chlamydomonas eustigma TaxID=1157962 RepID=A0A250WQ66_9CHLO|nr:hypothetical protein CEUSTIGMA_g146.t1 [Chlamydomonas eustigma]|eukprot:GAX72690.1 hypothetical protein CEUSTIGMA_g146.t1 [Chlamydomonas eustigma]